MVCGKRRERIMKVREQLRIAMMGHKRIPSREGGIEIVVEELSTRMAARGHRVVCYNRRGRHIGGRAFGVETRAMKDYKGVQIRSTWTLDRRGLAALTASVSAALRCAFGRYDVVHIHAEGPAFMCWLPKLFKKKVVVTVHGLDHKREKWGKFASAFILCGERNAVRFANTIIVLSRGAADYFREEYGRETVLIPNGIDRLQRKAPDCIREQFGLLGGDYILFLGRIVPEKGVEYLIRAFRETRTNKKLVIAGSESDSTEYVSRIHALAAGDSRIVFTGFVQGSQLQELFSNAYIYVLPSDLEGMPLSLLEAMSYGNCCLTSDIGECADVITDKGFTFRRGDVSDLREKLQMLCDAPETVEKYRAQSSDYICGRFNWETVTDETLNLYRGLMKP